MKKTEHEKKNILEGLRKLAKEAIEIRKRIKSDTKKLSEIKDKFIEKSKDKNFSFTIKVGDGSIRAIKNKNLKLFKVKSREFDKLDTETKKSLYRSGLFGVKVFLKHNEYEEAFNKNKIPKTLADIVYEIHKKPFNLSVYIDKKDKTKMIAIEHEAYDDYDDELVDDEAWEDLLLNIYPEDYQHFTDNDPADLSEIEQDNLGIEEEFKHNKNL